MALAAHCAVAGLACAQRVCARAGPRCAVDAVFYSWALRSYARTHKYTAIIIAYVFGAGAMTVSLSPNFGRLFKRQAANEGARLLAVPPVWLFSETPLSWETSNLSTVPIVPISSSQHTAGAVC